MSVMKVRCLLTHCRVQIVMTRFVCPSAFAIPKPSVSRIAALSFSQRCASHTSSASASATPVVPPAKDVTQPEHGTQRGASSWRHASHVPIHPDLIVVLRESLSRLLRTNEWLPVADIYSDLPTSVRRAHVRPHKALVHVLRRAQTTLDIVVSPSGLYCGRGPRLPADPALVGNLSHAPGPCSATVKDARKSGDATGIAPSPSIPATAAAVVAAPESHPQLPPIIPPAVDFYYDVELPLAHVPPPPPDFDVTPSSLCAPSPTQDGTVLALSTFVSFIPSFFVPLQAVLADMPGYTEDHVNQYLHLKATEIVSVGAQRYIRLHGGYRRVSLEGNEEAEARFDVYRPRLAWVPAFEAAFGTLVGEWVPLPVLLARVSTDVLEALPWGPRDVAPAQRAETIFFFAQMQHRFGFAMDAEGRGAVLLRPPGYGGLDVATSPTPRSVSAVLGLVPMEGTIDISQLHAKLPPSVRTEVESYYGSLDGFLAAHRPLFYRPEGDAVLVMRTRYHERLFKASLPLEKQLELALANRQKQKVRSLRRQLAFRDNPAHPFHDPDNLAQEVSKYLPRRGFVQLKVFIKSHVPEELHGFLPKKLYNFFSRYPQYFQQFEYQKAGTWCLCRPGHPLPRGVIKPTFTEDDLLALCAEYLQTHSNNCSCSTLYLHLPRAAQEVVRKHYGGMFYFLQKYPDFFRIVLDSDVGGNTVSTAIVHLVQMPHARTGSASLTASALRIQENEAEAAGDEEEDEDEDGR